MKKKLKKLEPGVMKSVRKMIKKAKATTRDKAKVKKK
jgi:hypothetical protein